MVGTIDAYTRNLHFVPSATLWIATLDVSMGKRNLLVCLWSWDLGEGRIEATRAESQWIVAARPLCHLQYPVAYLSRLQKILLAAQ